MKGLWAVNALIFFCAMAMAALVDANGRLPGLSERPSLVLFVCVVVGGSLCSAVLAFVGDRGRAAAFVVLAVYLVLALPLLL